MLAMRQFDEAAAMGIWEPTRPVRIGILFSQSGASASAECAHLKGAILALDQINASGGIRGRRLEAVICDPASDLRQFRTLTHKMIVEGEIANIFGCCISTSRKAVQPIVERHNVLLWYPTQFEGFEYSPNIIYGGPCPNQNVLPLAHYLIANGRRRVCMIGSDYVFPRESNRVMRQTIERAGGEVVGEFYVSLDADHLTFDGIFQDPRSHDCDAIFSTVTGTSNKVMYECYRSARLCPSDTPIVSVILSEQDVTLQGAALFQGHLVASTYFESNANIENQDLIHRLKHRYGDDQRANILIASSYAQLRGFADALSLCRDEAPEALLEALGELNLAAPHGAMRIDAESHCTYLSSMIARATEAGSFEIIQTSNEPIKPDPYMLTYR